MCMRSAIAQEQYMLNGKPISKETYNAAVILQASMPLLQSGRNQEAVDKLLEAEKLDPNIAEVHHNLGLGLAKLGRSQEALNELETARQLKPDMAVTWMTLGGLYQSQGQVEKALAAYSEFVKRFPGNKDTPKVASLIAGMKKEIAEGTLAIGSGNGQPPADNYVKELKGSLHHWPSSRMPIKVFIKPGQDVPGFKPQFEQILAGSFMEWSQASQGKVTFQFVATPDKADVECSWTNDPFSLKNRAEAGETELLANSQGIAKGTLKFLTVPLVAALPLTDNIIHQICLHEIGHVLGFGGHTTNPEDIMFFSTQVSDRPRQLSARDAKSIQMLYSMN